MTENEIKKLKAKYGDIYQIEVDPEEEGGETLVFLFRAPDRAILGAASKLASTDLVKAAEVMINNCLLAGPKEELEKIPVFQAVSEQFERINEPRKSQLKKI